MSAGAALEPHPPSRQCMCAECAPSFERVKPGVPEGVRGKLRELRDEFQRRTVERAPGEWSRLNLDVRAVLLMIAGIDPSQDTDLATLAGRDWREFTPPERRAIAQAASAMRWQLNGARNLSDL